MYKKGYLDRIRAAGSIREWIAGLISVKKGRSDKSDIAAGGKRVSIGVGYNGGGGWGSEERERALIVERIGSPPADESREGKIDAGKSTGKFFTGALRW